MQKLRQIAVIIDPVRIYQRKLLPGIADYANETDNWQLYVEESPPNQLPDFRRWNVDGVLAHVHAVSLANMMKDLKIPQVQMERQIWNNAVDRLPAVNSNHPAIGWMGAEHLLSLGFKRLAFCGFPNSPTTLFSRERAEAFRERAEAAGAECDIYNGRHIHTKHWVELQKGLIRWLGKLEKPIGIMAASDLKARHLLEACRAAGLRVPEDVAVLSVDNDELLCEATRPSLSSIEQGARRAGYEAAALLDRILDGEKPKQLDYLIEPVDVVKRQSTEVLAVEDEEVLEAVRYIRNHIADGVRVTDVVNHVGVSQSTLLSKFKKELGHSIHYEIRIAQLNRAKQLIATTDMPLKLISYRCGFSHIQHMTNVFHEVTGESPGGYRKKLRTRR